MAALALPSCWCWLALSAAPSADVSTRLTSHTADGSTSCDLLRAECYVMLQVLFLGAFLSEVSKLSPLLRLSLSAPLTGTAHLQEAHEMFIVQASPNTNLLCLLLHACKRACTCHSSCSVCLACMSHAAFPHTSSLHTGAPGRGPLARFVRSQAAAAAAVGAARAAHCARRGPGAGLPAL